METMNNISNILERYEKPIEVTDAPHELSASVNYILKYIPLREGQTEKQARGYWNRKVKLKGLSNYQLKELVDKARQLPPKYNRGGWLTNQLK